MNDFKQGLFEVLKLIEDYLEEVIPELYDE